MKLFEQFLKEQNDEKQKVNNFYSNYKDMEFELIPISDPLKQNDLIIGEYYSKLETVEIYVSFYETEKDGWVIHVSGKDNSHSSSLNEKFYYKNFNNMLDSLKVNFLNLDETSNLSIYLNGKPYQLNKKDNNI
jgi:hypothetical protein